VSDYFDFSIFVDADIDDIERWYVERFLTLKQTAFTQADAYFRRYADLSNAEAEAEARDIWHRINEINLRENILPTKERASLILEKGSDHSVRRVRLRR
jgi:type I pantothenate kinase